MGFCCKLEFDVVLEIKLRFEEVAIFVFSSFNLSSQSFLSSEIHLDLQHSHDCKGALTVEDFYSAKQR